MGHLLEASAQELIKELIEKSKQNDKEAFTTLVQMIQGDLYKIARTKLTDIDDINDAIQNTILNSYKHIYKLKDTSKFKSWILKILINECNTIYKSKKRSKKLFDRVESNSITYDSSDTLISEINSKLDLENILSVLNSTEKLIVTLHYNENYSCSEIAKIIKMNRNTIKSHLARSKQKIKKYYEKGGINNE